MAKQTFTTGQVLTAAQMTSLQQTAMLGGAASAKTASYTLVAADAGTAITMSNAGATTITVNTGLFAAGDTVHITNLGAGVSTITAGTATVNSSASLALAQYESGFLDFTSTSAAIFVKGAGAAAASGGMTLISTTTLTGASVSLTSIPATYKNLQIVIRNYLPATDSQSIRMTVNSTSSIYRTPNTLPETSNQSAGSTYIINGDADNAVSTGTSVIEIFDYANTNTIKVSTIVSAVNNATTSANFNLKFNMGIIGTTSAISSIQFVNDSGNFTSGTVLLYGVS